MKKPLLKWCLGAAMATGMLFANLAHGQFLQTYGGIGQEEGNQIIELANGHFVVLGSSNSFVQGNNRDVYMLELDAAGNVITSETYGNNQNERGWAFVPTDAASPFAPGYTISAYSQGGGANGGQDYKIMHVDAGLNLIPGSSFDYGTNSNQYARVLRNEGGGTGRLIGTGYHTGAGGAGANDFSLFSVNWASNVGAARLYGNNNNDFPHDLHATGTQVGNIIAGYRRNYENDWNGYIVRTRIGTDDPFWMNRYDEAQFGTSNEVFNSVIEHANPATGASEITAVGYTTWVPQGNNNYAGRSILFARVNTGNGTVQFARIMGGTGNDQAVDIIQTSDGGFAILAISNSSNVSPQGDQELILVKTDYNGVIQWTQRYGGDGNEFSNGASGKGLIELAAGGYAMVGNSNSYSTGGDNDILVVTTDAFGNSTGQQDCDSLVVIAFQDMPLQNTPIGVNNTPNTGQVAINQVQIAAPVTPFQPCQTCFADQDPAFTTINTITYDAGTSGDVVWDGKIFVPAGQVITVDGVLLDVTNVDVVFDPCARIEVINGGTLRANNSVFRACDQTQSWSGIDVQSGSEAEVNECTFKNAQIALHMEGANGQVFGNVTNNLFNNNYIGLAVTNNTFDDAITGNTFVVDDNAGLINFNGDGTCAILPAPGFATQFFGISNFGADLNRDIAQNDFVSAFADGAPQQFIGINNVSTSSRISNNTFTDMFRSIDVGAGSNAFVIENNEIEITLGDLTDNHQIRVDASSNGYIAGNELDNTNDYPNNPTTITSRAAIYVDGSNTMTVRDNEIHGFEVGIQFFNTDNAVIGENRLKNIHGGGILVEDCNLVDVACNQVDMDFDRVVFNIGIGVRQNFGGGAGITIRGNCVTEANRAIVLRNATTPTVAATIPLVVNNYLYNYHAFGVVNFDFTGPIGSGLTATTAGRNSFISNNIPAGAVDVASNVLMNVNGNFGISTVSAGVTVIGNGLFNSTATCGNQIGTISSQISADELCDGFIDITPLLIVNSNGNAELEGDFINIIQSFTGEIRAMHAITSLKTLSYENDLSDFETLYTDLTAAGLLTYEQQQWFDFTYHKMKRDYAAAASVLATITPVDENMEELMFLEELSTMLMAGQKAFVGLPEADRERLTEIDNRRGTYAAYARDFLQLAESHHNYIFKTITWENMEVEFSTLRLDDLLLDVYPNPSNGQFTVNYHTENTENAYLRLFDPSGRLLSERQLQANAQSSQLDISELSNGVYILSLEVADREAQFVKVIKR